MNLYYDLTSPLGSCYAGWTYDKTGRTTTRIVAPRSCCLTSAPTNHEIARAVQAWHLLCGRAWQARGVSGRHVSYREFEAMPADHDVSLAIDAGIMFDNGNEYVFAYRRDGSAFGSEC